MGDTCRRPARRTGTDDDGTGMDTWGAFFEDVPADLLFECIVDDGRVDGGISVYRDRIVLGDPSPRAPSTLQLREITGWQLTDGADDVLVSVRADRVRRTRLPVTFHRAIAHALHDTLGGERPV